MNQRIFKFIQSNSTDFEVHRNWLRITHNLPLKDWYFDILHHQKKNETIKLLSCQLHQVKSIWTLDYPPLFAYFEYLLTLPARFFDKNMLESDKEYTSDQTKIYQRLTVMVSDLLFLYAISHFMDVVFGKNKKKYAYALLFVFIQYGFLLVDNIHFQYNQLLQGICILALTKLYQAPAIFFFLLKSYCFEKNQKFNLVNFLALGISVIAVFLISFFPFLDLNSLKQIMSRLFPFQRGLVHAYWSPNFWALYSFADKVLFFIGKKILRMPIESQSTLTSGVVQVTHFDVLPQILPIYTILIIIAVSIPLWYKIFKNPKSQNIFLYSSLQMFIFYMFGYHVHEKAILLPLGIYQLWAIGKTNRNNFILLFSFVSGVGLLPLLPEHQETGLKLVGLFSYHLAYWAFLKRDSYREVKSVEEYKEIKMNLFGKLILLLGIVVAIYGNVLHYLIFSKSQNKYEFFPLMIHSVYGGILNVYFITEMYVELFRNQLSITQKEVKKVI